MAGSMFADNKLIEPPHNPEKLPEFLVNQAFWAFAGRFTDDELRQHDTSVADLQAFTLYRLVGALNNGSPEFRASVVKSLNERDVPLDKEVGSSTGLIWGWLQKNRPKLALELSSGIASDKTGSSEGLFEKRNLWGLAIDSAASRLLKIATADKRIIDTCVRSPNLQDNFQPLRNFRACAYELGGMLMVATPEQPQQILTALEKLAQADNKRLQVALILARDIFIGDKIFQAVELQERLRGIVNLGLQNSDKDLQITAKQAEMNIMVCPPQSKTLMERIWKLRQGLLKHQP
jgi:hypothetical protein